MQADPALTMPHGVFTALLNCHCCRIKCIVPRGQVTLADRPCLQDHEERVLLLAGAARVAGGVETALEPGRTMLIPAGGHHHVTLTHPDGATVWLTVHLETSASS